MTIRRRTILVGIGVGVLAGMAVWLWPRPHPHLLLVTLDTTRADRLGCYGYAPGRTPVLDALAASGVLCERAYTVAPLTLPAHASLFTGLYPAENGVRTNGRGRMDGTIHTLAEVLQRQGYDTAAFVSAFVLSAKFGLDRGFRNYDDDISGGEPDPDVMHRQRPGAAVVDAALEWLGKPRSGPFFCWVHLYDPHAPYVEHSDLFGDAFAGQPYDGEIAYVDRQVGRLVEFLKTHRLDSQTLVVIVGDHGEGLSEHLERTHGSTLYNSTMHVPLIFRQPARIAPGGRVATNVSLVDVSPTILDLLGVAERRKISGKSIKPALLGGAVPASPCYGASDDPFLANGWSPLRCLLDGDWKYIRTTRVELYDLAADPGEQRNLAEARADKARAMESGLTEFESRLIPRAEAQVQLSEAERRALASLGYVGGAKPAPAGPALSNLPDIKDMLPFDNAVEDAGALISQGALEAAIGQLRSIIRQAPSHTPAHLLLATALRGRSEFDDAVEVLNSLIAARPDCRDGHYGLGLTLLECGRVGAAIPEFLQTLEIDPDFAEAHYCLGKIYAGTGRTDVALTHFDAVLEIDRCHVDARLWRAQLRSKLGWIDAALADFQNALQCDPHSAEVHHNLAWFLADHGNGEGAREHFLRAVELRPRSAEMHFALGLFLLRQRQYEDAVKHLALALELRPGDAAVEKLLREARQAMNE